MRPIRPLPDPRRRGAALLLSFLVLIVILMICYQVVRTVGNDQIEAQRNLTQTAMDYAISSAMLQVEEDLKADGEAAAEDPSGSGSGVDPSSLGDGADPSASESAEAAAVVDSKMDTWAQPASTAVGEQELRIFVVDEDSKFNVLNMLQEDEEEAQLGFDTVVRILDLCREGTEADIDGSTADLMARAIQKHLTDRESSLLPMTPRLSDPEDDDDDTGVRMPQTMREFVVLEPFEEQHFRDFFDSDGVRVHAIDQFLTIYTAPVLGSDGTPAGGYEVNVNTAPLAVLTGLFDTRVVDGRFWREVVEYRNQEEERSADEEQDAEPMLDEFGNEVAPKKFYDDLSELEEVRSWGNLDPEEQAEVQRRLRVDSNVFTVYVVARRSTAAEENQLMEFTSRSEREAYERNGTHLLRVVRRVVWRRKLEDTVEMIPLVPWEVLDYAPLEILDQEDEDYF